jgi:hypothetical protein
MQAGLAARGGRRLLWDPPGAARRAPLPACRAAECFKKALELEANDASYLQLGQLYAQQVGGMGPLHCPACMRRATTVRQCSRPPSPQLAQLPGRLVPVSRGGRATAAAAGRLPGRG